MSKSKQFWKLYTDAEKALDALYFHFVNFMPGRAVENNLAATGSILEAKNWLFKMSCDADYNVLGTVLIPQRVKRYNQKAEARLAKNTSSFLLRDVAKQKQKRAR